MNGELRGPKVRVEKLGTSDRGGGLLVAQGGMLVIRGKLRSRTLGALDALQGWRFDEPDGRSAELTFNDLSRWAIEADDAGLVDFARLVEAQLGRAGLVTDPPGLSQRVRTVMGTQAKRRLPEALLALAVGVGAHALTRSAGPLGWPLIAGALLWVTLLGVALFQDAPEGLIERVRSAYERRGWALTLLLPLCLAFGAGLGMQAATARTLQEAQTRSLRAQAEQARQSKQQAEAERAAEQQAELASRIRLLEAALNAKRWPDAKAAYDALAALDPRHPTLPTAWATLEPQLAALEAREREQAIAAALRDARRMQKDPVVCDDARAVAAAWKAFSALPASDPRRAGAVALVPNLERCRKVVARALAVNAAELRRQARIQLAPRLQDELRRAGHLVNVALTGKAEDGLRISGDALDAKAVPSLTEHGSKAPGSLFARLEEQGVRHVELRAGERRLGRFALQPRGTDALAAELLAGMGLGAPLALPELAAPAP
jgi:tetratricopeptide (TPR) repeat protein